MKILYLALLLLGTLAVTLAVAQSSPIKLLYPSKNIESILFYGTDMTCGTKLRWSFDARKFTHHTDHAKLQTCVDMLRVSLKNETAPVVEIDKQLGLVMQMRCFKHYGLPTATQGLIVHGMREGQHYQVRFFLRDTTIGDAGTLELQDWKILAPEAIRNSRFPFVVPNNHSIVLPPFHKSSTVQLDLDVKTYIQSKNIFKYIEPFSSKHLNVCFSIQTQDPVIAPTAQRSEETAHFEGDGRDQFADVSAQYESLPFRDIFGDCVSLGEGPKYLLSLPEIPVSAYPFRLALYLRLNELGHIERSWPKNSSFLGRLGRVGSKEREHGAESGEILYSRLNVVSLDTVLPTIDTQGQHEWMAEKGKTGPFRASGHVEIQVSYDQNMQILDKCAWCTQIHSLEMFDDLVISQTYGEQNVQSVLDEAEKFELSTSLATKKMVVKGGAENLVHLKPIADSMRLPHIHSTCLQVQNPTTLTINQFMLSNVPVGIYKVRVFLGYNISHTEYGRSLSEVERAEFGGSKLIHPFGTPGSSLEYVLAVQAPEAFKPNYTWQELRAWHTVPPGAETRLPLSSLKVTSRSTTGNMMSDVTVSSRRTTRVSTPFQLQLRYPAPCKFFFRTNVFKDSYVANLEREAGLMCSRHLPAGCLHIVDTATGHHLPNVTAVETDLFNKKLELRVNILRPECSIDLESVNTLPPGHTTPQILADGSDQRVEL
jgi:hypothetical protein